MEYYDLYCERLGPGLLAEPVNAVTNAAFFVGAWLAWRDATRADARDAPMRLLVALMVAIGIGSSLFHTFATHWARVLDELPILLFQLIFVGTYAHRVIRMSHVTATGLVAAYFSLALYCRGFGHLLNGSLVYAPAVGITLLLGVYHWRSQTSARSSLLCAGGTLCAAVALRTLDAAVCDAFPLGTHFAWHLLVALVAYLCLRGLASASGAATERR